MLNGRRGIDIGKANTRSHPLRLPSARELVGKDNGETSVGGLNYSRKQPNKKLPGFGGKAPSVLLTVTTKSYCLKRQWAVGDFRGWVFQADSGPGKQTTVKENRGKAAARRHMRTTRRGENAKRTQNSGTFDKSMAYPQIGFDTRDEMDYQKAKCQLRSLPDDAQRSGVPRDEHQQQLSANRRGGAHKQKGGGNI